MTRCTLYRKIRQYMLTNTCYVAESLDPKERGHGEELVELAVKVLVENRSKANDSDSTDDVMWSLLVAVLMLESVQIRRTVSSPLRLASCAIYGLLYAPDIAAVHFSSLDIKGILHETLTGHWMVPILLAASASSKQVQKWLDGIGNIHEQQLSEAADAFFTAFENGSYSKVPEMVDFWETLRNSSSSAIWRTESSIQSLQKAVGDVKQLRKAAEESSASLQSIELDRLYYVEDLSTRPSWFPPLPAISITTAIGDWWQCQGKASNRWPWWHHMVAGERECEEALNWRSAMEKGLRRRISLTKILSMLLSPKPLSEEELMEGKRVVQEAWGTKVEMEGSTNDSRGTPPLLPVLFETGFAIHRFARCAANSHSDTMADDMSTHCVAARSALSVLVESSSQVCRHLADALTRKEGQCTALILPANASIAFASELVSEHMAWISSCFVSWRKLMDELMDDDSKIQLLNELRQASSSLDASVQFLMHALQSCVDIDIHAAAKDLVKELEGRLDGCSALWEHESEFDAESAIAKLLKAQKGTANRLIESGERVLKNLKLVKQLTK